MPRVATFKSHYSWHNNLNFNISRPTKIMCAVQSWTTLIKYDHWTMVWAPRIQTLFSSDQLEKESLGTGSFLFQFKWDQGWRSGESTRLPPMWPGFDSRTRRHMWAEFVFGSRPCYEGFSPGTPVFLPPQKPTLLYINSNSTWKQWRWEPLRGFHWNSHLFSLSITWQSSSKISSP